MKIISTNVGDRKVQFEMSSEELQDLALIFGITMTSPEAPLMAALFGMKQERLRDMAKAMQDALITLGPDTTRRCSDPNCPACRRRAGALKATGSDSPN